MNIYLTGDTHGRFERIACFCKDNGTTPDDLLIMLGDAGINYYGGHLDKKLKQYIASMPITLLCIHGNHERRPTAGLGYEKAQRFGGEVMVQPEFPNQLFALDGEVYELNGQSCIAIGGAYSIDKEYRLMRGGGWWPDEQPSAACTINAGTPGISTRSKRPASCGLCTRTTHSWGNEHE